MYLKAQPLFLTTETPLHMGTGTDLGVVDMPIQRERHTSFPKIEASGLKGGLREVFNERLDKKEGIDILFGPEQDAEYAASLGFSDGRLLFYPVKSMKGVFAWVTCEEVLYKFINDIKTCGKQERDDIENLVIPKANTILSSTSNLFINKDKIFLEEYLFEVSEMNEEEKRTMHWILNLLHQDKGQKDFFEEKMKTDLVVLSGDDFKDFVNYSTEVITRTKIDSDTGTVADGALFTEEYLPVHCVLYSIVFASPIFKANKEKTDLFEGKNELEEANNILNYFTENLPPIIQLGGNATLGKGLIKTFQDKGLIKIPHGRVENE